MDNAEQLGTVFQWLPENQKQFDLSGWEKGAVGLGWPLGAVCPGGTCPTAWEQHM